MPFFEAFTVLDAKGSIALIERALMLHAVEFMLIVAIPVYILLFFFAWKYRAGKKKKGAYLPNWEHGKMEELIWWAIPLEIVLILGALTWGSTHQLDPHKPIESSLAPIHVQVVALDWKWLFIYPDEGIAAVNYLQLPVGRPVRFSITADAPMNSFWIPNLGGQIYAMTGMVTSLNVIADEAGKFPGGSSNYSGEGFAHMKFIAEAVPQDEFDAWVGRAKLSSLGLDMQTYLELAEPSIKAEPSYYGMVDPQLFDSVVKKFTDASVTGAHPH